MGVPSVRPEHARSARARAGTRPLKSTASQAAAGHLKVPYGCLAYASRSRAGLPPVALKGHLWRPAYATLARLLTAAREALEGLPALRFVGSLVRVAPGPPGGHCVHPAAMRSPRS